MLRHLRLLGQRRWIVAFGIVLGLGALAAELSRSVSLVRSLAEALGLMFLGMIVAAVAARFWRGDDIATAGAGPAQVGFEQTAESLKVTNERVDQQVTELEERVFALEESQEENASPPAEEAHTGRDQ